MSKLTRRSLFEILGGVTALTIFEQEDFKEIEKNTKTGNKASKI